MIDVLSAAQLKRLTEHKYSSEGSTYLDPLLQKFWQWLVAQIPLTWAPNAITLVGLFVNVISALVLIIYSPDATRQVPCWAYFIAALGLFLYQSLDAIDGKQARRTKSSTPLGELFDHGCDSVSIVFVTVGTSVALQLGRYPGLMFFETFSGMFLFYLAHWQTYVSGTLKFGKIDVTEGQISVILLFMISGILGEEFWSYKLPVIGVELLMLPILFSIVSALITVRSTFGIIFMEGGQGKNGSTVAGTSVLSPVLPIATVVLLGLTIYMKSSSNLYENNSCLYVISFGIVAAKVSNRLIIAHMTKSEMDLFDSILIGPGMLFLNQYFNTPINEYIVLWMCFFYCTADLLRFSISVCIQICDYLNIYCFKITVPSDVQNNGVSGSDGITTDGSVDSPALNTRSKVNPKSQ